MFMTSHSHRYIFFITTYTHLQNTKMKSFIILALFAAVAVAIPVDPKDAVIIKYENDNIGVEGYRYASETSDGKSASEEGQLTNVGSEDEALEVRGQFSYVAPDGLTYEVVYTAGRAGFVPQGAHIPKAQ